MIRHTGYCNSYLKDAIYTYFTGAADVIWFGLMLDTCRIVAAVAVRINLWNEVCVHSV